MDLTLGLERADVSDKSGNVHLDKPDKLRIRLENSAVLKVQAPLGSTTWVTWPILRPGRAAPLP
jgi:hypothetical protein